MESISGIFSKLCSYAASEKACADASFKIAQIWEKANPCISWVSRQATGLANGSHWVWNTTGSWLGYPGQAALACLVGFAVYNIVFRFRNVADSTEADKKALPGAFKNPIFNEYVINLTIHPRSDQEMIPLNQSFGGVLVPKKELDLLLRQYQQYPDLFKKSSL